MGLYSLAAPSGVASEWNEAAKEAAKRKKKSSNFIFDLEGNRPWQPGHHRTVFRPVSPLPTFPPADPSPDESLRGFLSAF